jgi:hypothetical protein
MMKHLFECYPFRLPLSTILLYRYFWFHNLEKNDSLKSFSKSQLSLTLIEKTLFLLKKLNLSSILYAINVYYGRKIRTVKT